MSAAEITIKNVGPIQHLTIPVAPGATILRGQSDIGKSESLKAVGRLAGSADDLRPRHGTDAGTVEGLGIKITVGRSTRRSGELEALSIEGKWDLGDLIDPGIASPEAADARRIKALLKISGAKADLALFADLLPGGLDELRQYVTDAAGKEPDLVELAGKIKRALEAAARSAADESQKALGQAQACKEQLKDVDPSLPSDPVALQAAHTAAVAEHARMETEARAYRVAQRRRKEAEEKLSAAGSAYSWPSAQEAELEAKAKGLAWETANKRVAAAHEALRTAEAEARLAQSESIAAAKAWEAARAHEAALAACQGALAGTLPPEPDWEAIDAAAERVADAQVAVERGAVIRAAKAKAAEAVDHERAAAKLRERTELLRAAAKATDDVLSRAVASKRLRVRDSRLYGDSPVHGEMPFHALSDGTRTMLACWEKLERVRDLEPDRLALIDLPQRNWADLQPSVKQELIDWAVENNACIITAEVTDDEDLSAVVVSGNGHK